MIILPIKKRWYDMILSGKKREEYREIKPYWQARFKKVFQMDPVTDTPTGQDAHIVMFRNGYRRASPFIRALCTLSIKTGRKEWGAEPGKDYLVLTIRDILSRDSAEKEERDCLASPVFRPNSARLILRILATAVHGCSRAQFSFSLSRANPCRCRSSRDENRSGARNVKVAFGLAMGPPPLGVIICGIHAGYSNICTRFSGPTLYLVLYRTLYNSSSILAKKSS